MHGVRQGEQHSAMKLVPEHYVQKRFHNDIGQPNVHHRHCPGKWVLTGIAPQRGRTCAKWRRDRREPCVRYLGSCRCDSFFCPEIFLLKSKVRLRTGSHIRNSCVSSVFSVSSVVKNEPRMTRISRMNHTSSQSSCLRPYHSGWNCHNESCINGDATVPPFKWADAGWQKNYLAEKLGRNGQVPGRTPAGCSVKIKSSGWR